MGRRKITPVRAEFRKQLGPLMAGAGIQSIEDIQELFREMIGGSVDQGLEGELDEQLGYSKYDYRNKETDNSRNGHSEKTLKTIRRAPCRSPVLPSTVLDNVTFV